MTVLTVKTTMLYCPKCRATYQEGTQRFCSNDGGRLLPAPSAQKSAPPPSVGVFTSILTKTPSRDAADKTLKIAPPTTTPKPPVPHRENTPPVFSPLSKIIKTERERRPVFDEIEDDDSILELGFDPTMPRLENEPPPVPKFPSSVEEKISAEPKPLPKLVKPAEIPSGTAEIGDRQTNPTGRLALSWDNPQALVGQLVKGRYQIVKKIDEDEDSLVYLAEDKILEGRQTVVRVFMSDDSANEIFADERVSLAHLNHPNIAAVFDSGELPEGKRFVVSELIEGESLREKLKTDGQFNIKRTARIVRQISYALSEAHQNGVLHRNLKPENIMLTVSEAGVEQVKLTNFELSESFWSEGDLFYKSPEEIRDEAPTFASEIYSLAIIAFEMLTGSKPFEAVSERELIDAQKTGLKIFPSVLRADVPHLADRILEKALNFEPTERYPKARDFGEAFFNALRTIAPWEEKTEEKPEEITEEKTPEIEQKSAQTGEFFVVSPISAKTRTEDLPINPDIQIVSKAVSLDESDEPLSVKTPDSPTWEKRSPEPLQTGNWLWMLLPIIGVLIVLVGLWGIGKYLANRQTPVENPSPNTEKVETTETPGPPKTPQQESILAPDDKAPVARLLKQPENTTRYANNKENLKGELAKNFLGFEIFYPQDWKRAESETNFLDIAKRNADGELIEQMLITHYKSRGAMYLDKDNFPKLVEKSDQDLKRILGDSYKVLGKGETTIQNGRWKAFEVKFEGVLPGSKTKFFGRRLWMPVQVPSVQNGFVITMLATPLTDGIQSVEDVGVKGELADILENFEPEQK